MPCYDPPPPYAGKEKQSAETAVKILCKHCQGLLDLGALAVINRNMIEWFLEHRKIDVERLTWITSTGYTKQGYPEELDKAKADVAKIEEIVRILPPG